MEQFGKKRRVSAFRIALAQEGAEPRHCAIAAYEVESNTHDKIQRITDTLLRASVEREKEEIRHAAKKRCTGG